MRTCVKRMFTRQLAPARVADRGNATPTTTCSAPLCRSLQDFLCLIDVSFNDKVCRTSYLPQCDPPPRTLLEVYEAAVVTAPRVAVYQQMMIELSGRLAGAQAHVAQLETQLAGSNPPLFAAVQVCADAGIRLHTLHW